MSFFSEDVVGRSCVQEYELDSNYSLGGKDGIDGEDEADVRMVLE